MQKTAKKTISIKELSRKHWTAFDKKKMFLIHHELSLINSLIIKNNMFDQLSKI